MSAATQTSLRSAYSDYVYEHMDDPTTRRPYRSSPKRNNDLSIASDLSYWDIPRSYYHRHQHDTPSYRSTSSYRAPQDPHQLTSQAAIASDLDRIPTPPPDQGTVLHIENSRPLPASHAFVSDSEPLHVRQYCRTMTLAQSRVLHEVWDRDRWLTNRHVGYLVPLHLVAEGSRLSCKRKEDEWAGLHATVVRRYEDAWRVVEREWPRIPVFGAKKVVERCVRARTCGRLEVEGVVVRYALRHWTGYLGRLQRSGVREEEDAVGFGRVEEGAREEVKGRLREVLEGWMGSEMRSEEVRGVFERCGLVEEREGGLRGGRWFD